MFKDERMTLEPRDWISQGYNKGYKQGFKDAIQLLEKEYSKKDIK